MKDSGSQSLKEPSPMTDETATLSPPVSARAEARVRLLRVSAGEGVGCWP